MLLFIMLINLFIPDTVGGLIAVILMAGCVYFASLVLMKDNDMLYVLEEMKKYIVKKKKREN